MDSPAPSVTPPVRVFLLDDHEIVRRGLGDLLGATDDLVVVGEAGTAAEALRRIPAVRPDVALLDVVLPDGSGIDVCRQVRVQLPDTRCLILTSHDDDTALLAAFVAGASGYLLKRVRGSAIVAGIRTVAQGRSLLDATAVHQLRERLHTPAADERLQALTSREREVLDLVTDGCSNRQIADRLHLAEQTVKNYVSALFDKLDLQRRSQVAVLGAELRRPDRTRPPRAGL